MHHAARRCRPSGYAPGSRAISFRVVVLPMVDAAGVHGSSNESRAAPRRYRTFRALTRRAILRAEVHSIGASPGGVLAPDGKIGRMPRTRSSRGRSGFRPVDPLREAAVVGHARGVEIETAVEFVAMLVRDHQKSVIYGFIVGGDRQSSKAGGCSAP